MILKSLYPSRQYPSPMCVSIGTRRPPGTQLKEWLCRKHLKGWIVHYPAALDWCATGRGSLIPIISSSHLSGYETPLQIISCRDKKGVELTPTPALPGNTIKSALSADKKVFLCSIYHAVNPRVIPWTSASVIKPFIV